MKPGFGASSNVTIVLTGAASPGRCPSFARHGAADGAGGAAGSAGPAAPVRESRASFSFSLSTRPDTRLPYVPAGVRTRSGEDRGRQPGGGTCPDLAAK